MPTLVNYSKTITEGELADEMRDALEAERSTLAEKE